MKLHRSFLLLLFAGCFAFSTGSLSQVAAAAERSSASTLRVAAVQLRSTDDLRHNVEAIKRHLAECAAQKVQIAAFPECAVTSYRSEPIQAATEADLAAAEREISEACRKYGIAAVVGAPERRAGKVYNSALVISSSGEILTRYRKAQVVPPDRAWQCEPGGELPVVFAVGQTRAAVIICHDSRYPELSRLPVIAGARVIFYISHESPIDQETKLAPYRAQVQARAVENTVYIVHANAPATDLRTGSHGQSRLVAPDGNVLKEASMVHEEVLIADLDLKQATGARALGSLRGPLADWWRDGVKRVRVLD